jgi:hypothetical protein
MKALLIAVVIIITSVSVAHKKFDQRCSEVALVMNGHVLKLSSLMTQIALDLDNLPPKEKATARKAIIAVERLHNIVYDELNFLSLSIILRNSGLKKSITVQEIKLHLINLINDIQFRYIAVKTLARNIISSHRKKKSVLSEIDTSLSAFRLLVRVVLRDIVKIKPPKTVSPKSTRFRKNKV